jgi:hypothetical protein
MIEHKVVVVAQKRPHRVMRSQTNEEKDVMLKRKRDVQTRKSCSSNMRASFPLDRELMKPIPLPSCAHPRPVLRIPCLMTSDDMLTPS